MTPRPRAIGYVYPSGYGNLGDEAIQQAAIAGFRGPWPDARIRAFTLNASATAARHGIEAEPIIGLSHGFNDVRVDDVPGVLRLTQRVAGLVRRPSLLARVVGGAERRARMAALEARSAWRAWRWLGGADLLAAAGGGQLDDLWGGAWGHPYALARWAWLARRRKVPFVVLSVGFGTARSRLGRAFLRYAVDQAAYCSCRDKGSRALTAGLGVRAEPRVVPDLAFALRKVTGEPAAAPPLEVGISPMSYRRPHAWPDADREGYDRLVAVWADIVTRRVACGDRVRLFSTSPADYVTIDEVLARLKPEVRARCVREAVGTVAELLAACARVHVVVASRLHGVVLALVAERPVVALSHERKVRQLMDDACLADYCLDLETAEAEAASAAIDAVARRRAELQAAIARRVAGWRDEVEAQARAVTAFARNPA